MYARLGVWVRFVALDRNPDSAEPTWNLWVLNPLIFPTLSQHHSQHNHHYSIIYHSPLSAFDESKDRGRDYVDSIIGGSASERGNRRGGRMDKERALRSLPEHSRLEELDQSF